jgi:hypothetical protein
VRFCVPARIVEVSAHAGVKHWLGLKERAIAHLIPPAQAFCRTVITLFHQTKHINSPFSTNRFHRSSDSLLLQVILAVNRFAQILASGAKLLAHRRFPGFDEFPAFIAVNVIRIGLVLVLFLNLLPFTRPKIIENLQRLEHGDIRIPGQRLSFNLVYLRLGSLFC